MTATVRSLIVPFAVGLALLLAGCSSGMPNPVISTTPGTSAATLNRCGGSLASVAGRTAKLELTASFDTACASDETIRGTVTLTNNTTARVTGTTGPTPIVTLSRNGRVLWHSNGAVAAMAAVVDLAPGASMTYQATFSPLECDAQDESAAGFRDTLPHVPSGRYEVSAAIDLTDTNGNSTLITGPLTRIRIR